MSRTTKDSASGAETHYPFIADNAEAERMEARLIELDEAYGKETNRIQSAISAASKKLFGAKNDVTE